MIHQHDILCSQFTGQNKFTSETVAEIEREKKYYKNLIYRCVCLRQISKKSCKQAEEEKKKTRK